MTTALLQSDCPDLELIARGKVRDMYRVDADTLLIVASDRLSAFDVVMKTPIPGKGKVLTQLSVFWFERLKNAQPHHLITADVDKMPKVVKQYAEQIRGRCMLVKAVTILPVEAIVRGYIAGSGWKEYKTKGTVCDIPLPKDLEESGILPDPIYTPSTKAELGAHDENIHPDKAVKILGAERGKEVADQALALYTEARDFAKSKGIIIADTKFEFGVDAKGGLLVADEVLTPDSSRFWPAESYAVGRGQDSFDKQYVRDYLESIAFDKTNPVELPDKIVEQTLAKYVEAFRLLTGSEPEL